ncbi:MAG: ABC transporter ATP-binding protein [Solirubrobacterales bacterium]
MELTASDRDVNGRSSRAPRSLYAEAEKPAEIDWGALELHDVFKIYGSGSVETVALRGLDLRIEQGEMVAIVGPSGSGKSTLLSLAAALDTPSAGDVRALGRSLAGLGDNELAEYRARRVAIVFQSDNLWPALSARENVATALRIAGQRNAERDASEALATFGLAKREHLRPSALSGGEQQRVAIAAAAARRASLVLADEPTGELDEKNEATVLRSLRELRDRNGSAVVVVTHADPVAGACDRVVEIRDGRVEG